LGNTDANDRLLTRGSVSTQGGDFQAASTSVALSSVSGFDLWQWREDARTSAVEAGIPTAEVDWLLQEVAGLDPLELRLESFKTRSQIRVRYPLPVLSQLWHRRIRDRLPVQYLAGTTPWRHFSLIVSPDVLIPRPETEYLIDLAVDAVKHSAIPQLAAGHWADLGTGSGAIALGLADVFPSATIHAVDRSVAALAIAQQNAQRMGLQKRIQFYQGSWWEPLDALKGQFKGMVSNPPYIPSGLLQELQPEVRDHEPYLALNGGAEGLDCIQQLIEISADYLQPGGIWLIEMMAGQADTVAQLLHQHGGYSRIQILPDLACVDRFALAYTKQE